MKKIFSGLLSVLTLFGTCCFTLNSVNAEEKVENPTSTNVQSNTKRDTELVFVVDKSGSMHRLKQDTIGSFNSVLDTQKNDTENGEAYVTTVMFNDKHDKIHDRKNIKDVEHITEEDYSPNGCTALLDALGDTITELSKNSEIKDHKFIFAIITDGYENASKEYSKQQIKELIESKKNEGWEFVFCGANIDEMAEGTRIGINRDNIIKFAATSEGVQAVYGDVSTRITSARAAA